MRNNVKACKFDETNVFGNNINEGGLGYKNLKERLKKYFKGFRLQLFIGILVTLSSTLKCIYLKMYIF